eukprot:IDg2265t1
MRALRALLILTLALVATASLPSCPALHQHELRSPTLGRTCSTHAGSVLSWTICKRALRKRTANGLQVHTVPARSLPALLRTRAPRESTLVLFYGRHCAFSAAILPIFARVAARLPLCALAVEAVQLPALGATFGVHGLPTILRLQRGRADARYAGDRSYADLLRWAENVTGAGAVRTAPRIAESHIPLLDAPLKRRRDWA